MSRSPGITLKIFAIAASILVLLLIIAANTHSKINIINAEVKALSETILPVSEQIDAAIIATLEQEIHLERALRLAEKIPVPEAELEEQIAQFDAWAATAQQHFTTANSALLSSLKHQSTMLPDNIMTAVNTLQQHNLSFQQNASTLLQSLNQEDNQTSDGLTALLLLKGNEAELNAEGEIILEMLQNFAIATSEKASGHQQQILIQNLLFTLVAIVVGLLYSWLLVRRLSRPIEELNIQVQHTLGEHKVEPIRVRSKDEVGALTRQFNTALSNLKRSEHLKDMFGQYLDPRLISHIEAEEQEFKLNGEKQWVTVLMTSIDNLDWHSDEFTMHPEKMVQAINEYLRLQTSEVGKLKGIVNFTLTDILVFWCHPFSQGQKQLLQASEALLNQIQGIRQFQSYLKTTFPELKHPENTRLRAGLACGEIVVANMGPAGARSFTVIGDEVNAASRKAGIARFFDIDSVMSQAVASQLNDEFAYRSLGKVLVPGKEDYIEATQLLGKTNELSGDRLLAIEVYKSGLQAFYNRDFEGAAKAFQKCLDINRQDNVAAKFLAECETLKSTALPSDWQHVWRVKQK